jgi:hypothetical protein
MAERYPAFSKAHSDRDCEFAIASEARIVGIVPRRRPICVEALADLEIAMLSNAKHLVPRRAKIVGQARSFAYGSGWRT